MTPATGSPPSPPVVVESDEVSVRRARLGERFATAAMCAFVAAITALGFDVAHLLRSGIELPLVIAAVAAVLGAASAIAAARSSAPGGLAVDADALTTTRWTRRRRYPLARVESAWLAPSPRGIDVEFTLRNGSVVSARVPDVATGHRLLDAAKLDIAQRTCTIRLGRSRASIAVGAYLVALLPSAIAAALFAATDGHDAPVRTTAFAVWCVLMTAATVGAATAFAAPVLTIGADGLTLRKRATSRYVRFADVVNVKIDAPDVKLWLRDGTTLVIPATRVSGFERDAIYGRICDALRVWKRDGGAMGLEALDRQGRSLEAWRAAMGALIGHGESYRRFALTREDLLRALDDASTPPERRVGAALALLSQPDPEASERVRVAASATANDRVRVALDSLARGGGDAAVLELASAPAEVVAAAVARRRD